MKFRVDLTAVASATVDIELSADDIGVVMEDNGITDPSQITEDMLHELISERALDEAPTTSLCIHCSGYDRPWSVNLGDEWEIADHPWKIDTKTNQPWFSRIEGE